MRGARFAVTFHASTRRGGPVPPLYRSANSPMAHTRTSHHARLNKRTLCLFVCFCCLFVTMSVCVEQTARLL
jgi:hypothetical protein